jgi:hypothetical protein
MNMTTTWDPIAYLKGLHTKQLMNLRKSLHAVNTWAQEDKSKNYRYSDEEIILLINDESCNHQVINLKQLKDELATREHVPNKQEAKLIRQQKAKAQRS